MTSNAVEQFETVIDQEAISEMDLIDVDVLVDIPSVISLARLRYEGGTLFEMAWCPNGVGVDDVNAVEPLIPQRSIRLGARISDTLGCPCKDEVTYSLWLFE
ncbi:hypothetical protein ABZZ79_01190 [Streptomyces sp. NPDC006458]|uniref:hypothetical protein n=1 Tax=Streptomyces sp. NPDC006458 TaxID=3154302 RepID=UPI0033BB41BA